MIVNEIAKLEKLLHARSRDWLYPSFASVASSSPWVVSLAAIDSPSMAPDGQRDPMRRRGRESRPNSRKLRESLGHAPFGNPGPASPASVDPEPVEQRLVAAPMLADPDPDIEEDLGP